MLQCLSFNKHAVDKNAVETKVLNLLNVKKILIILYVYCYFWYLYKNVFNNSTTTLTCNVYIFNKILSFDLSCLIVITINQYDSQDEETFNNFRMRLSDLAWLLIHKSLAYFHILRII